MGWVIVTLMYLGSLACLVGGALFQAFVCFGLATLTAHNVNKINKKSSF